MGARIENHDPLRAVRNGKLTLISLEPDEGCTLPRVLAEHLAINAGDHALVPLVRYQERRADLHPSSPAGETMMLIGFSEKDVMAGCPAGLDNTLMLRATAEDMPPCETRVRVWVEDSKLRIAKI